MVRGQRVEDEREGWEDGAGGYEWVTEGAAVDVSVGNGLVGVGGIGVQR